MNHYTIAVLEYIADKALANSIIAISVPDWNYHARIYNETIVNIAKNSQNNS